jgi:hypothetical protein
MLPKHPGNSGRLHANRSLEKRPLQPPLLQQGRVESRDRAGGAVPVDGRNLCRAPPRAVDHLAVTRPGRVPDCLTEQLRLARHRPPEALVETGELDSPGLVRAGQPGGKIQTQRRRHLVAEEGPDPATVSAPNQLTDQMPVEQRRLADRGAGLPRRRFRSQPPAHLIPVKEQLSGRRRSQCHHPRLMGKELAHGRLRPELGPVPLHGGVQLELPALDEQQRTHGDERLAHRVRLNDAVATPGAVTRRIGRPRPTSRPAADPLPKRPAPHRSPAARRALLRRPPRPAPDPVRPTPLASFDILAVARTTRASEPLLRTWRHGTSRLRALRCPTSRSGSVRPTV